MIFHINLRKESKMKMNGEIKMKTWWTAAVCVAALLIAGCEANTDDPPAKAPKTWNKVEVGTNVTVNKVAYGNRVFVAVGRKGSGQSASAYSAWSNDGVTWTESSGIAALGTSNMHVFFGGDSFIATGGSSGNTNWAESPDGKTWTAIGSESANFNAKGGAYGNGQYIISGSAGRIAYSSGAGDWTIRTGEQTTFTGSSSAGFINAAAFGKGKFVAGGGSGHVAWASDPGGIWKGVAETETIFDNGFINALIFADGRFIAAGGQDSGTGKAAYSDDGETWNQSGDLLVGKNTMVTGIAYGDGAFVVEDNQGKASYSTDGETWTLIVDTPFESDTTAINSICYGKDRFVMAGANGRIAYSIPE